MSDKSQKKMNYKKTKQPQDLGQKETKDWYKGTIHVLNLIEDLFIFSILVLGSLVLVQLEKRLKTQA